MSHDALVKQAPSLFKTMRLVCEGVMKAPEVPIELTVPRSSHPREESSNRIREKRKDRPKWGIGASQPNGDLD